MINQIIVQQDNLELRAKKLSIPFTTFEHGPRRYMFSTFCLLEVEEVDQTGKITSDNLRYERSKKLFFDDRALSSFSLRGDYYSPDSPFTTQFNNLIPSMMDEIFYAIEDYMNGRPSTRPKITIIDESDEESSSKRMYGNTLYFDL